MSWNITQFYLLNCSTELDEKTKTMLKVIDEDADSFAQRAEMYYRKRPELISMVEDFYRTHRSLAERYDQIKSESGIRLPTSPWSSPLPFSKFRLEKTLSLNDKAYDSYSEAYGPEEDEESNESEVDDPEEEESVQDHLDYEEEEVSSGSVNDEELMKLKEEVEKLKEENELQKDQLKQKDDEKREVIRQLSMAIDLLREENVKLRKLIPKTNTKKEEPLNKPRENFFGKLFSGLTKSHATHLVAL